MKSKRLHNMMLPDDILLLQEFAFIQHKLEFKKYLTESLKNQEEFEKLKVSIRIEYNKIKTKYV